MTDTSREAIERLAERLEGWKNDLRYGTSIAGADQDLHAAASALLALLARAEAAEKERDAARADVKKLETALAQLQKCLDQAAAERDALRDALLKLNMFAKPEPPLQARLDVTHND